MSANSLSKKITSTIIILLLSASVFAFYAQETKSIKDKISDIKGDAKSITIETSEGKFTFKGDEAKDVLKLLKQKRIIEFEKDIAFHPDLDEADVFIFRDGKLPDDMFWVETEDDDKDKEISVEKKDGITTVTIKTKVDGKEETKVLTGNEAEDFLKKENQKIRIKKFRRQIMMEGNCCCCRMPRKEIDFWGDAMPLEDFDWTDISDNKEMKKIIVKEEDGQKIVTIETIINGEKQTETLKGKEAEEYLKKMEQEDKLKIEEKNDSGKKTKKIILKK